MSSRVGKDVTIDRLSQEVQDLISGGGVSILEGATKIKVVTALPATPDSTTIYMVTG